MNDLIPNDATERPAPDLLRSDVRSTPRGYTDDANGKVSNQALTSAGSSPYGRRGRHLGL